MIRDLFLPLTGTPGDESAVAAAIALARTCRAHVSVVQPVDLSLPIPSAWGITPDPTLGHTHDTLRAEAARQAVRWRERLDGEEVSWEVRVDEPGLVEPPRAMARQALYSDLSVMAAPAPTASDAAFAHALFNALLFESGRPVLMVPHAPPLPVRHAIVAWKSCRHASRALHDALPLLAGAGSIDIVTVDPAAAGAFDGADPGVDIATHLARHALPVNLVSLPRGGQTVASALLRHASESGAQLLVAGGYGHSRLREWALGGTTRDLLLATHLPILFSH
ncbi:universal stress protein [Marilutibacter spongiae]|uniref:Universal stress protein n=1 Tax=Marilutibacter spongiae TaxID=2025720 RepID=A0A7W3TN99_9GAMM|nr:universal stress protein [Lysobacter spongiae]MBB1061467.1 universal stress protein [Lysobacter spongiae]